MRAPLLANSKVRLQTALLGELSQREQISSVMSIVAILMVSWVHWNAVPRIQTASWLCYMCLVQMVRLRLVYQSATGSHVYESHPQFRGVRFWVNVLNGLGWGAIWFVLDTGSMDFLFMFKFGAIAGTTGIAVNSLGVVFPVYFGFLASQIAVTVVYMMISTPFLLPDQRISFVTGAVVYSIVLAGIARNTEKLTRKALEQGFERETALVEAKESHQREQALRESLQEQSRQVEETNQKLNEVNERLLILARQDVLTGIFNRRHLVEELERNLQSFRRYNRGFSLILLDIDHFKQINDTFGHQTGDLVLKAVTQQIHSGLREIDIFGRWGGEEFLCVLPDTAFEEAYVCAERLCHRLAETQLLDSLPGLSVTASFGVVACRASDDINMVMSRADTALYQAKAAGRNQVVGSIM